MVHPAMKGRNMDLRMDSASCLSHHGALISRGDLEGWAACDPDLGSSPFRLMNDLLQVMAFPFCVNSILNSIPPHLAIHEILNPETSERRHSHHVLTWVTEKPSLPLVFHGWCPVLPGAFPRISKPQRQLREAPKPGLPRNCTAN